VVVVTLSDDIPRMKAQGGSGTKENPDPKRGGGHRD
jgi:hypothetical protein